MDYETLAGELLDAMRRVPFHRDMFRRKISDSTKGEAFVLHFLSLKDGGAMPGGISGEMGISSARIAAVLNGLEDKGLITRRIDKNDRRKIVVSLTEAGRAVECERREEFIGLAAAILEKLGDNDARDFVRIIKKMIKIPLNCGVDDMEGIN